MISKYISRKWLIEGGFWRLMIGVMFVALEFIGLQIFHRSWKMILLLCVIFGAAACIHLYRSSKKENYIKNNILAIGANPNRKHRYDYLGIIVASFVIITHAVQTDISKGFVSGDHYWGFTILYTLTLSCNLIYVMLSGALLLPYKEESIVDFYLKRVSKVGLPLAVYYIFYLWQNMQLKNITPELLGDILLRLHQGNTPESPHYWLIYTILSIYIVIPFFRYMMKSIPYKKLTALVVVIIIFMTLSIFSGYGMTVNTFLASWIGVAIIGYWVTREETEKYYKLLMVLGAANVAAAIYLIYTDANFLNLVCNCSPIMTLIAAGIFAFICTFKNIFDKGNWIVRIFSKYSYAIILIHWWSLHWITSGAFGISVDAWNGFGVILSYIVTVGASIFMGFLIDNLVVVVVEFVFDKVVVFIKKLINYLLNTKTKVDAIRSL